MDNTTQGRAPANAGHIVSVEAGELHQVIDLCKEQRQLIDDQIPFLRAQIEGATAEDGTIKNLGLRAKIEEIGTQLGEMRTVLGDFEKELHRIDKQTDRSDTAWRDGHDVHNPRGWHTEQYRAMADVFKASYAAFKEHGYTKQVEGYTRATDQSSTTDTLGGILVPTATWDNVAYIMGEKSYLRAFASRLEMPTDDVKVPYLPTIPTMYVQGTQGDEVTHGSLIFDDTRLMQTKTLIGLNVIPNQLVQDAISVWSTFWARVFTDAMALKENKGFFSESPGDTNGAFSGVIQEIAAATGAQQHVVTMASAHFSLLTFDDLVLLQNAPNENSWDGSRWFCSKQVAQYIWKLKDSNGFPILNSSWAGLPAPDPRSVSGIPRSTPLLLDPLHVTSAMPSTNAASKAFLVYGNPSFTFWGERSPMAIEFSRESEFKNYNTVMRVAERIAVRTIAPDAWGYMRTSA